MEHVLNRPFIDTSIIIAKRDFGDGHILITFLTQKRGIIKAFAFGGKRMSKRFQGSLEYFKVMDVEFCPKTNNGETTFSISAVKNVKDELNVLSKDMTKYVCACYVLELSSILLNHLEPSGKSGSMFFNTALNTLNSINEHNSNDTEGLINMVYEYCLSLFHETGFIPELNKINETKEQLYRMEQLHTSILEHSPRSFSMLYEMLNSSCRSKGSPVRNH